MELTAAHRKKLKASELVRQPVHRTNEIRTTLLDNLYIIQIR